MYDRRRNTLGDINANTVWQHSRYGGGLNVRKLFDLGSKLRQIDIPDTRLFDFGGDDTTNIFGRRLLGPPYFNSLKMEERRICRGLISRHPDNREGCNQA